MSPAAKPVPSKFTLLVYRMPAKPTAGRVAVWRLLKKTGAIYLQQSVCVFPENSGLRRDLNPILRRIDEAGGEYHLLPMKNLSGEEHQKLVAQFLDQTSKHYNEIIENCEVNFTKEIEFETFRHNFTYEEAEEIRSEFEKIVTWYERVRNRDWFGAPNQSLAEDWLKRCERLLEDFEAKVFEAHASESADPAAASGSKKRRRGNAHGITGVATVTMNQLLQREELSK